MRPRGVRSLPVLVALALATGCNGHHLTEHEKVFQRVCGNHSCPAPGFPRATAVASVDGRKHLAPETITGSRHVLRLTVTPEKGSSITRYWVTYGGSCCDNPSDGPVGGQLLDHGAHLSDGQVLTISWTPSLRGSHALFLDTDAKAPQDQYEDDGLSSTYLGSFTVS